MTSLNLDEKTSEAIKILMEEVIMKTQLGTTIKKAMSAPMTLTIRVPEAPLKILRTQKVMGLDQPVGMQPQAREGNMVLPRTSGLVAMIQAGLVEKLRSQNVSGSRIVDCL